MSVSTPTAAAVIIGNEILSGKIHDTNTPYLIRTLRSIGVELGRVSVVPDIRHVIVPEVRAASETYDHVFTSGGVGPTHDDITIACVAEALGRPVIRDPELEALLRRLFGERLKDAHLRMADVPEGAELIIDKAMTVPILRVDNVFVLPGIPKLFEEKVQFLKGRLASTPYHARYVYTTLGEGTLAPILDAVLLDHPGVEIGSYPRLDTADYRVRITLESKDEGATVAATEALVARLPAERIVRVEDPAGVQDGP